MNFFDKMSKKTGGISIISIVLVKENQDIDINNEDIDINNENNNIERIPNYYLCFNIEWTDGKYSKTRDTLIFYFSF